MLSKLGREHNTLSHRRMPRFGAVMESSLPCPAPDLKLKFHRGTKPLHSAPEQHDHNDDHQYQAKAPAVVMEWRASVEATTTEKDNQNN